MGGTLTKFSVSALLFDYVLTGPLSTVVAGQYVAGFIEDTARYLGHPVRYFPENAFAAVFGILVTFYFWWKNTQGIHESSTKAVQIMIVTTVMVVILILWCTITLFHVSFHVPPNPLRYGIILIRESPGWMTALKESWLSHLTMFIVFVGFGHSVLAMSGEETLAQVKREIAHPKLKNLKKAAVVIGAYALLLTALTSFFAVMIIPDQVRPERRVARQRAGKATNLDQFRVYASEQPATETLGVRPPTFWSPSETSGRHASVDALIGRGLSGA
jgi:amino acid transporter